jgi:hypothetical protein
MGLPTITVPKYELTIPSSGKIVKYRPFLVKEEKILLMAMETEDTKQIINATKEIIKNCITGEELNVDTMPLFDIEYIFLNLRAKSKGEIIELSYKCPKCEGTIPLEINIDDIQVKKDDKHISTIKLNDELGIVMKYPTINLQEDGPDDKNKKSIESLFNTIINCIDYIYDKETTYPSKDHTKEELKTFLESLTDGQFQSISQFFETQPKLQHEVNLHCKNKVKKTKKECGHKEKQTLEGLNSFFA